MPFCLNFLVLSLVSLINILLSLDILTIFLFEQLASILKEFLILNDPILYNFIRWPRFYMIKKGPNPGLFLRNIDFSAEGLQNNSLIIIYYLLVHNVAVTVLFILQLQVTTKYRMHSLYFLCAWDIHVSVILCF